VRQLKRIQSKWITVILLIGLVTTSSIAVIEAQQITRLNNELDDLQGEFDSLQQDYDYLRSAYSDLFSDYTSLEAAFEDPLTDPLIPTYEELEVWLEQDDTDECEYIVGAWACGDYAAMLMTRAKEMNWRVLIAVISFSFEGDLYYGNTTDAYGSSGHAFNVVECTDGIWYIEPQSDGTWYIIDDVTLQRSEFTHNRYYNFVDSNRGTIWDGYSWWTNHYNRFA
jgi:hypothetical protein